VSSRSSPFILSLPKAELHLHLEGAIDPPTLLELWRKHGKEGTLAEVEQLYRYADFNGFLMAFKAVTEDLQTAEDYELITYRLMEKLKAENVLHAEAYVSVGVCLWRKQDFDLIFEGLERGRQRGERDFGVSLLWIFDAVRQFGAQAAQSVFELAVRYRDRHVVGIGIGHGLTAWQDPELVEELATRQIPMEICITSNLRTGCCPDLADHPVRRYFDQGLMATLNSDDPAMFRTSLAQEYQLARESFGFTDEHLRELARNSFEASFLPAEKKLNFLNLFDATVVRP
jgi:aminodeoxyfutalosine deaminase